VAWNVIGNFDHSPQCRVLQLGATAQRWVPYQL
jgi:hypothetical protein